MKKLSVMLVLAIFFAACGGNSGKNSGPDPYDAKANNSNGNPDYDPNRGEGKFKTIDLGTSIDTTMASNGGRIYGVKCSGCHKITEEKLVGPGWKGVTVRHAPVWIMNFVTNTDAMLNKDPKAQAQLEICLVRMPNQNLSDDDARNLLEFMRRNDAAK